MLWLENVVCCKHIRRATSSILWLGKGRISIKTSSIKRALKITKYLFIYYNTNTHQNYSNASEFTKKNIVQFTHPHNVRYCNMHAMPFLMHPQSILFILYQLSRRKSRKGILWKNIQRRKKKDVWKEDNNNINQIMSRN